jgi:hypothetical protein
MLGRASTKGASKRLSNDSAARNRKRDQAGCDVAFGSGERKYERLWTRPRSHRGDTSQRSRQPPRRSARRRATKKRTASNSTPAICPPPTAPTSDLKPPAATSIVNGRNASSVRRVVRDIASISVLGGATGCAAYWMRGRRTHRDARNPSGISAMNAMSPICLDAGPAASRTSAIPQAAIKDVATTC